MSSIVIIAGGASPEREVSLRSGSSVMNALRGAGHDVELFDPKDNDLNTSLQRFDVAFPVLHGVGGEDGQIQKDLERIGLPYVGSGIAASKLCFNKVEYKHLLLGHRLPTPQSAMLYSFDELRTHSLADHPFVLKPFDGGSSIDTFIVRNPGHIDDRAMTAAFSRNGGAMLLEELIEGVEITVAVLGSRDLPVIEIIPPESGEFDYENKYNGATQELCPPLHVPEAVQTQARTLAVDIHALCGCEDYSRTDMVASADGSLMVLETNTIPGMTDQSLFPKAAAASGMTMLQLCDELVQMALTRRTARS